MADSQWMRARSLRDHESWFFDGKRQDVFPGDTRPIQVLSGYSSRSPSLRFIRIVDKASGVEGFSNPIYVTERESEWRVFWGDPHWQTCFSDGIRCPERNVHLCP